MTRILTQCIYPLTLVACALSIGIQGQSSLIANDSATEHHQRVILGDKQPTEKRHEDLKQNKKAAKAQQKTTPKKRANRKAQPKKVKKSSKDWEIKCLCPQMKTRYYSPQYAIKSIGASGKTIVTQDETVWEVSPHHAARAMRWPENSRIVIKPNWAWFSSYDYALHNQTTGNSVQADLANGPLLKYAILIQSIQNNLVYLSDGSVWSIDSDFRSIEKVRTWKLQQAVLVGENDGWSGGNYILINLNENNYITVDAKQLPFTINY